VKATGQPEPQVTWFHKDVELQPTVKVNMVDEDDGVHRLTIASVTMTMAGEYKAVAKNVAGQVEHAATVTITGRLSRSSPTYLTSLCACGFRGYITMAQYQFRWIR